MLKVKLYQHFAPETQRCVQQHTPIPDAYTVENVLQANTGRRLHCLKANTIIFDGKVQVIVMAYESYCDMFRFCMFDYIVELFLHNTIKHYFTFRRQLRFVQLIRIKRDGKGNSRLRSDSLSVRCFNTGPTSRFDNCLISSMVSDTICLVLSIIIRRMSS